MNWATAWHIARRDLSGRFKGLRLLLVCLFLGVGALAAIGSLTSAIRGELNSQGQMILGGDLQVEVWQRGLDEQELAFLESYGTISRGYRMQAMASAGEAAAPVELKAVEANWPMVGSLLLQGGSRVSAPPPGQAYLAPGAADRLGLAPGDRFTLGTATLTVAGIIDEEPDRLSEGFALGQTVIVPLGLPEAAGLLAPGAMYESKTRVLFDGLTDPEAVEEALEEQFPRRGLDVDTRDRASPGAERFVGRMGEFLTLVGLAALVIAGIGIGGGVNSYLEARRGAIATLKILGATSGDIVRIYALQIGAAALAGAAAGLVVGVAITPLLAGTLGELLPVSTDLTVDPLALARAAVFGLLVALVFAAPPLVRARDFPAMALMRARVSPLAREWRGAAKPVALGIVGIAALALIGSPEPLLTAGFMGGAVAMLGVLALLGKAVRRLAQASPRPGNPILRAALANLYRPGAATGALVTALGFGLSAFVLLAVIQTSLDGNIRKSVPERAPDYIALDVPKDRLSAFLTLVEGIAPGAKVDAVPTMRGSVLAYGPQGNPTRIVNREDLPDGARALGGERALTYAAQLPSGNVLTEGEWWAADHAGEPEVSIDEEVANAAGIEVGHIITISVLGVERTARVTSLRRIDWESMGFNYLLVFSPNTLADVPHNFSATVQLPEATPVPAGFLPQLVREFPTSSVIEVGPLLTEARAILDQVALAILAAASVAVLAGIAVLLGAIAAARAARTYDTVILRVLGASRGQLLALQFAEFGLLAALLAGVALLLGTGLGWLVIVQLFEFEWLPNWPRILGVLGAGLALVLGFALAASLPLLRARPASALRAL